MPPFGGFGAFGMPPSTGYGGLRFEDLFRPSPRPSYPPEPDWIDSAGELSDEERRRLMRQAILRGAMALSAPGGQIGTALASAGMQGDEVRQEAIRAARARQEEEYGSARRRAEETFESERFVASEEERAAKIRALVSMRDQVVRADPSLRERAEAALQTQDGAALRNLLASLPEREAFRARGLEPDDPFADETIKAQIQTAAERQRKEAELELLPRELGMRSQADLAEEAAKKAGGFGTYYTSPSEMMNAQTGRMPKTVELNDGLYQVGPDVDPLTGNLRLTLLKKQDKSPAGLRLVTEPGTYGQKPTYKVFDPATGQMRPLKDKKAWYELLSEERDAQVPAGAPTRTVPAPAPKAGKTTGPRPTQVTAPDQAPAGRGGGLRAQTPRKPGALAAPTRSLDPGVLRDVKEDLPKGENYVRMMLRKGGYSDPVIDRYITEARSGG